MTILLTLFLYVHVYQRRDEGYNYDAKYECQCLVSIKAVRSWKYGNWLGHVTHTWLRHQMEAFSALLALYAGNSPVTGEFPSQGPATRSFDLFFDLNGWVNNRDAANLRRHLAHYDVTVMLFNFPLTQPIGRQIMHSTQASFGNV